MKKIGKIKYQTYNEIMKTDRKKFWKLIKNKKENKNKDRQINNPSFEKFNEFYFNLFINDIQKSTHHYYMEQIVAI